jgi:hypothetical protein
MKLLPYHTDGYIRHCPLCGWGPREDADATVAELRMSYDICECCGCEYGLDDDEAYYSEWVTDGMKWFDESYRPAGWTIDNQFKYQVRPWPPK